MDCCRIPDPIEEKINSVMKEHNLKKFSKLLRVAAELSWNGWNKNATVEKLFPEYNSVEKHGHKTRLYLEKTVRSLTRELKGLDYDFPPKEKFCSDHMWFAAETISQQAGKQNSEHYNPMAGQINPVVRYETHDAEVTAKFLAFLTSTNMDWSVLSNTFIDLIVHALELRASRLSAYYTERCARINRRTAYTEPLPESMERNLQEDHAALNDVLAKFEPYYNNLMDVFHRNMELCENLPSCPDQISAVTCLPVTIRWNAPPITRNEWMNFQSRMREWMAQMRQDPDSFETVGLLERIPEIVERESSSAVLNHSGVREWLDGVRRLAKSIRSRNVRRSEVEGIVHNLRDYDKRSREALVEIRRKLAEFEQCDHQLGVLRERSEARLNAMIIKDIDSNSRSKKGETDMLQEYTFGVTECVPPWTFRQVVSLLKPIAVNLAWFVRQGYDNCYLDRIMRENNVRLLAGMVCNSKVFEGDNDTATAPESKRQRHD